METCRLVLLRDAQLLLDCHDFVSCSSHVEDQMLRTNQEGKDVDRRERILIVGGRSGFGGSRRRER